MECTFDTFKKTLDIFLSIIPDKPVMQGYRSNNYDLYKKETNSIIHWIRNMKLEKWIIPDNTHDVYS